MLTKAQQRAVTSLQDKRNRDRAGLYVVEGDKLVREAVASGCDVESIYAEQDWIDAAPSTVAARAVPVTAVELRRLSAQQAPQGVLAVVRHPSDDLVWCAPPVGLVLVLEQVQDPGNLGNLLRVAAWFGVADVVTSPDCADAFAPKAVQASMGALFHVHIHVRDVGPFVAEARAAGLPAYATTPDGEPIYSADVGSRGLILFGNESSGLTHELLRLASHRLAVPAWGTRGPGRDSLNVAAAAAVVCSEFRRRGGRAADVQGQASGAGVQ